MKPFDIELAKAGHPVRTRDGRDVRIVCFDMNNPTYPIVAIINDKNCEYESPHIYKADGKYNPDSDINSDFDLFMKTKRHSGWVNIYANTDYDFDLGYCGSIYSTKEEAIKNIYQNQKCIDTVKINWVN